MKKLKFSHKHPMKRQDFFYPECDLSRLIVAVQRISGKKPIVCLSRRQIEIAKSMSWEIEVVD